ncbi:MAG TPA: bifunctional homocysteine S-methyltransferase/methylenetetrahydrofolate reductase [Gaiellales bacterium]|jgi:homocysteine S-methyltransferase|nr:bifunctional homocysteine S-methyltransferase/methylenetetrahydrofolate reductase [Gaiellales bacterium]
MARTLQRLGVEPLVSDGGMGSLLQRAVVRARCPEEANLIAPEQVVALHVAFIRAGSDLILTNTYGANPAKLAPHKLEDRFEAINQAGVKLAREAREVAGRDVLIGGSIGPLGAAPGRISPEEMEEAFSAQAAALEGRGVDLFVLETFTSLEELLIAARAARSVAALPLIAQVTVGDDAETVAGLAAADVPRALAGLDPVAVGVNCSLGPQTVLAGLESMRVATDLPLTAQANAGMPNVSTGRLVYPNASPEYFGEYAAHALQLGAVLIGGCCGTTPEHVAAIRRAVSERRPPAVALQLVERELPIKAESEETETLLEGKLRRGEFVISVELDPPKGGNVERLIASARSLVAAGGVDVFDVNDNPLARARMNALIASALIEQQVGTETIPHVTPRDASVRGIESMLLGAHAVGIRNVLAVTGDPPPSGDPHGSEAVYEVDAIGLTRLMTALNSGVDYAGKAIDDATSFHVGVAVNPVADDPDWEIERFAAKIEAGARFAMTQVLFDSTQLERFLERLGGPPAVPLIVGVWPVRSHALALRLHNEVPGISVPADVLHRLDLAGAEAAREGMAVARDLLAAVRDLAAGAYLVPPFKEPEAVLELLTDG